MQLRPRNDNVIVRLDPSEDEFGDSGIARPDIARDKPMWGTVVAAGPGRPGKRSGFIEVAVKVGQRVLVPWATGHDLTIGGALHVNVREDDIVAAEG